MLSIEVMINGKTWNESGIESDLNLTLLKTNLEILKDIISCALNQEEADQIKINMVGDDLNHLSCDFLGPEHLIEKVESAFSR